MVKNLPPMQDTGHAGFFSPWVRKIPGGVAHNLLHISPENPIWTGSAGAAVQGCHQNRDDAVMTAPSTYYIIYIKELTTHNNLFMRN